MKVVYMYDDSPRSDGRPGKPTQVTLGKCYDVVEDLDLQYSIVNDAGKMARYSKYRFKLVDNTPIRPLRDMFNELTLPMRMELKAAKQHLDNLRPEETQYC